ncbi:uncharacterized protein RAG0_06788 [Rhynchosporium agropyri]|uniref:Uncharacterized protein n=1 Tax=Rhynchosporium agropyri TaxID=914238 RepID=A0A1E1KIS8_9HELO|nr:uncharacterized protein RAG0_06788 [Rhynchosporium agropyri]
MFIQPVTASNIAELRKKLKTPSLHASYMDGNRKKKGKRSSRPGPKIVGWWMYSIRSERQRHLMIESGPGLAQPTSPSNMSCHGDSTGLSLASSHDILALQELTCFGCITRHPRSKRNFEDQTVRRKNKGKCECLAGADTAASDPIRIRPDIKRTTKTTDNWKYGVRP